MTSDIPDVIYIATEKELEDVLKTLWYSKDTKTLSMDDINDL